MYRNEENNMFKFATKELSQDAFICWCINWINYEKHHKLGEKFLKLLVNDFIPELNYNAHSIEVKILRQFLKIDILLIINNKYYIIIEDKVNSNINKTLEAYKRDLIDSLDEENIDKEDKIKKIRETKSKIGIRSFDKNNIYTIYLKTGEMKEKIKADKIITSEDIIKILEEYIKIESENDIINDFYKNIKERQELLNEERTEIFVKNGSLKVGTLFLKKYQCLNCFSNQIDFKKGKLRYDKTYQYSYRAYKPIKNTKVGICIPRLNSNDGWINDVNTIRGIITEFKIENNKKVKLNKVKCPYRYEFLRKRNIYNKEVFQFIGIYYLSQKESTETERVWKKYDMDEVILNAEKMQQILDNYIKINKL